MPAKEYNPKEHDQYPLEHLMRGVAIMKRQERDIETGTAIDIIRNYLKWNQIYPMQRIILRNFLINIARIKFKDE